MNLNKVYGDYAGISQTKIVNATDLQMGDDDDETHITLIVTEYHVPAPDIEEEQLAVEPNVVQVQGSEVNPRVERVLRELHTSYNPTVRGESLIEDREIALFSQNVYPIDVAFVHQTLDTGTEPTNFQDAWHNDNLQQHKCWSDGYKKELMSMVDKKVWTEMLLTDLPVGR